MTVVVALVALVCLLTLVVLYCMHRLVSLERHYRATCLATAVVTLHNGELKGNAVELTAPALVPDCSFNLKTQVIADGQVRVWVELEPGVGSRKKEAEPIGLEPDVAAALA